MSLEWLLLNQESHHLAPELIITDNILKDLAIVSSLLRNLLLGPATVFTVI